MGHQLLAQPSSVPTEVRAGAVAPQVPAWFWAAMGIAIFVKMGLVSGIPASVYSVATHDDALFLRGAHALLTTGWLGPFDNLTIIKGPGYPLFIAATSWLGWPLLPTQQALYVVAVVVLVLALRHWLPHYGVLAIVFLALLFNPGTFLVEPSLADRTVLNGPHTRVLREGIYASLAILVIGLGLHQAARLSRGKPASPLIAAGLGLALSSYWLTREEGIWLAGPLALITGMALYGLARHRVRPFASLALLVLPGLILWGANTLVAKINKNVYGIQAKTEVDHPDYAQAVSALMRVSQPKRIVALPVPRPTRQKIYAASPAFAELEAAFEGPVSQRWANPTLCRILPETCGDVGGFFMWAFREAVAMNGYYRTGTAAMEYYRRLASEVGAACDQGRLACDAVGTSMIPAIGLGDGGPLLRSSFAILRRMLTYGDTQVAAPFSRGTVEPWMVPLVNGRIAPPRDGAPVNPAGQGWADAAKLSVLRWVAASYELLTLPLALVAVVGCVSALARRRWDAALVVCAAMLGVVLARVAIVAVIDTTLWPANRLVYFQPAYPFLFVFISLGLWIGIRSILPVRPAGAEASAEARHQ